MQADERPEAVEGDFFHMKKVKLLLQPITTSSQKAKEVSLFREKKN